MIPQMEASGYPRVFATNVTITSSVQALLVPPSHNAVIYSLATGGTISVISLFMAGVMPGLLLGSVHHPAVPRAGVSQRTSARRGGAAARPRQKSRSMRCGA